MSPTANSLTMARLTIFLLCLVAWCKCLPLNDKATGKRCRRSVVTHADDLSSLPLRWKERVSAWRPGTQASQPWLCSKGHSLDVDRQSLTVNRAFHHGCFLVLFNRVSIHRWTPYFEYQRWRSTGRILDDHLEWAQRQPWSASYHRSVHGLRARSQDQLLHFRSRQFGLHHQGVPQVDQEKLPLLGLPLRRPSGHQAQLPPAQRPGVQREVLLRSTGTTGNENWPVDRLPKQLLVLHPSTKSFQFGLWKLALPHSVIWPAFAPLTSTSDLCDPFCTLATYNLHTSRTIVNLSSATYATQRFWYSVKNCSSPQMCTTSSLQRLHHRWQSRRGAWTRSRCTRPMFLFFSTRAIRCIESAHTCIEAL